MLVLNLKKNINLADPNLVGLPVKTPLYIRHVQRRHPRKYFHYLYEFSEKNNCIPHFWRHRESKRFANSRRFHVRTVWRVFSRLRAVYARIAKRLRFDVTTVNIFSIFCSVQRFQNTTETRRKNSVCNDKTKKSLNKNINIYPHEIVDFVFLFVNVTVR